MKELSPLERQMFKTLFGWEVEEVAKTGRRNEFEAKVSQARAAVALCEEKIRQAIELTQKTKKGEICAPNNFSCSWPECECRVPKYTPDEIMQKLSEPK